MKKAIFLIIATLMLTSCEALFEAATGAKKAYIGNKYEILVVCDDELWDSELGIALQKTLRSGIPGLPQYEEAFTITRISSKDFTGVKKDFRNILFVKIDMDTYTAPAFRSKRDLNAEGQVIMTIQAPDIASCAEYVNENSQTIIDFFNGIEMERRLDIIDAVYNTEAYRMAEEQFGCTFKIPMDIQGYKVGKDFIWFSDMNTTNPDILNFAIYSYPYTSDDNFSKEHFIHMRDSMMKANIQGTHKGEHVETDRNSVTLEDKEYNDRYIQEARGLWRMGGENFTECWGGPFVSHSVVDEMNNRVIVVEAFLFSSKKNGILMRDLEASLYTLELPIDKYLKKMSAPDAVVIEGKQDTEQ